MRIDKFFSSQELASRSETSVLIKKGAVTVNDVAVKSPAIKVDPENDCVRLHGEKIIYREHLYVMLNKPQGVVSATDDNVHKTVVDILPEHLKRKSIFPAGRLDKDTLGFVLMTTDGDFAHQILSPQKHISKEYVAIVDGVVDDSDIKAFESGMELASGEQCKPALLEVITDNLSKTDVACLGTVEVGHTHVRITLVEGKYHQIKRMFAARDKNVILLKRIKMGQVLLDENLAPGQCRELTKAEIDDGFVQKSQK